MRLFKSVVYLLSFMALPIFANDDAAIIKIITNNLTKIQPEIKIEQITPAPIAGLWQVELLGGHQIYVSADGKYLLQGNLYQFEQDEVINLTQQAQQKGIVKIINNIDPKEPIIFAPEKPKAYVTVFTDTTCGYCQKLHSEMAEINKLGIEVRYLAFPRGGKESQGYQELNNVWCAQDRQDAMTRAKNGQKVEQANIMCKSPVMAHYEIGNMVGVTGTPAIVLEDGSLLPGYMPAKVLAERVLERKNNKKK